MPMYRGPRDVSDDSGAELLVALTASECMKRGYLGKAVRALMSGKRAPANRTMFETFQKMHPPCSRPIDVPDYIDSHNEAWRIGVVDGDLSRIERFDKTLKRLPGMSARDNYGYYYEHFKAVEKHRGNTGLAAHVSLLSGHRLPEDIRGWYTIGRLVGVEKPNGNGLRAVGIKPLIGKIHLRYALACT